MSNGEKVAGFTEDQISAAGRVLADRSAEACNVDKDDNWKIYGGDFIDDARAAIRALASQPAAPVAEGNYSDADRTTLAFMGIGTSDAQPAAPVEAIVPMTESQKKGWNSATLVHRLYNDMPDVGLVVEAGAEIQNLRAELAVLKRSASATQAAPPVQQTGDVRDLQADEQYRMQMAAISTAAIGYWKESEGILPEYDTVPLRDVAKLYAKHEALATTRPSAALTETQQRGLSALADRIEQAGNALPLFIDTTAAIAIRSVLAASSGAVAVPEGGV